MRSDLLVFSLIALVLGLAAVFLLNRDEREDEALRGGSGDGQPAVVRRENQGQAVDPRSSPAVKSGDQSSVEPSALPAGSSDSRDEVTRHEGRIEGRVIGLDGEAAVAATVTLESLDFQILNPKLPPILFEPLHLETRTNAEGRFVFEGLPHRTRALLDARSALGEAWGQAELWSGSAAVIRLFGGAVIEGAIGDESGKALAGLHVTSVQIDDEAALNEDDFFNGALVARSDDAGRFTLRGLPPGELRLECQSEDWWIESEVIEIRGQERIRVELLAWPALSISGRVLRSGAPVHLAAVMAVPESGSWREGMRGGTATTDRDGRFEIRGLRPGSFTITVQNGIGPIPTIKRREQGESLPDASPRPKKWRQVTAGTRDFQVDL